MTKQWKQSLEQSDILSDGTPFDGNNIDAPISSRAAPADTGSSYNVVLDTTISSDSNIVINSPGMLNLSTSNFLSEVNQSFEVFIDAAGAWHTQTYQGDTGVQITADQVISAGDGNVRVSEDSGVSQSIRVVAQE